MMACGGEGGGWGLGSANQFTPGQPPQVRRKGQVGGGLLPWPLIQWWRWPSGLTLVAYRGLQQPTQASPASFSTPACCCLNPPPLPSPAWQRQVLERGGGERKYFGSFAFFCLNDSSHSHNTAFPFPIRSALLIPLLQ